MTRRELAGAVAGVAGAAVARAAAGPDDVLQKAIEDVRESTAAIAKYDLPMATEPAFEFRA